VAVFNYALMAWMRWPIQHLGESIRLAVINGKPSVACKATNTVTSVQQAFYYQQNTFFADRLQGNAYTFVPISLITAPFSMHEVQGFERLKRASVLTTIDQPTTACPTVALYLSGSQSNSSQITTWTSADVASLINSGQWDGRFETHVAEQKNRGVVLGISEDPSTAGSVDNPNVSVSGFAFRIGLKAGFNKRTTSEARR